MFRRKKKQAERLPWYRARNYKGDLTENEKRQLDAFRSREKHPAADYDSLPEEVQRYINGLELELYDKKQEALVPPTLIVSGIGGFFLCRYILGYEEGSLFNYFWSVSALILPWIYYAKKWRANADEFLPRDAPTSPGDEAIRMEWELDYIHRKRRMVDD